MEPTFISQSFAVQRHRYLRLESVDDVAGSSSVAVKRDG